MALFGDMMKEEFKTLKVTSSTHARLSMLSTVLDKTLSEVINDMMEIAYPEIIAETDKMLDRMPALRQMAEEKRKK